MRKRGVRASQRMRKVHLFDDLEIFAKAGLQDEAGGTFGNLCE
jgi:hypothetical protein